MKRQDLITLAAGAALVPRVLGMAAVAVGYVCALLIVVLPAVHRSAQAAIVVLMPFLVAAVLVGWAWRGIGGQV